jgi:hypothetical protein
MVNTNRQTWLAVVVCLILFFVANRAAYQSFFADDDFDNLGWTTIVGGDTFRDGFLTPKLSPDNFRPTGHYFYRLLHRIVRFDFPLWVLALQLIHLCNVFLVFRLCRTLGSGAKGAAAGALVYAFHPALFAAFWKPMYVFDLLCGTFIIASANLYLGDRLVLSVIAFWLAYKAKEVALFYPIALALIEYARGRRWLRLIPFFAISLCFGLQAIVANRGRDTLYALQFTPKAIWECTRFYLAQVALLFVPLLAWARRDRGMWLALLAFLALIGPHWFLPGRLFAVYLYVPMLAGAVLVALAVRHIPARVLAALGAVWLGYVYLVELRAFRRAELTSGPENKRFFDQACAFQRPFPNNANVYFEGGPPHMANWGITGVYHLCYSPDLKLTVVDPHDPSWKEKAEAVLHWNDLERRLSILRPEPSPSMNSFHLERGWHPWSGSLRWSTENPAARVLQEPGTDELYVRIHPTAVQVRRFGKIRLVARVDGQQVADESITEGDVVWKRAWPIPPVSEAKVRMVEFDVTPYHTIPGSNDRFGVPFADFGIRRKQP